MDGFELNKILAALLVAGIIASFTGFIANHVIHPQNIAAHGPEASEEMAGAAAAPQNPEPVLGLIASADAEHGKQIAKACAACHNFDKGGPNGVGPNLWNVMTRGRGQKADFAYSEDMKAKGGSWNYEDLNHFLWKPKKFSPGTKMVFVGLKKPEDRAAVIGFLRTLADSPPGLPSDADIAAEAAELAPPKAEEAPAPETAAPAAGQKPAEEKH